MNVLIGALLIPGAEAWSGANTVKVTVVDGDAAA